MRLNPTNASALQDAPDFAAQGAVVYQTAHCDMCHVALGGTACATTTSPAFSEVGQAVPPASRACGRLRYAFKAANVTERLPAIGAWLLLAAARSTIAARQPAPPSTTSPGASPAPFAESIARA